MEEDNKEKIKSSNDFRNPQQDEDSNEHTSLSEIALPVLKKVKVVLKKMITLPSRAVQLLQDDGSGHKVSDDLRHAFSHLNIRLLSYASVSLIIIFYFLTGIYIVNPGEVAVVKIFGKPVDSRIGEGIHYRLPWPVSTSDIVNISVMRREGVGIMLPEHETIHSSPKVVQFLTGDENIIDIKAVVQYRIKDAQSYLYNVKYPPYLLINQTIRSAITEIGGGMKVDDLLTIGKERLQSLIREKTQNILDQYQHGLEIVGVTLNKVYPPGDVAQAFRDVQDAKQEKQKMINDAMGYSNTVIPQARGQADQLVRKAEGYKSDVVNRARGEADRFESMLAEYEKEKKIYPVSETRYRLYLETLEKVMTRVKKYMVNITEGQQLNLRFFENSNQMSK